MAGQYLKFEYTLPVYTSVLSPLSLYLLYKLYPGQYLTNTVVPYRHAARSKGVVILYCPALRTNSAKIKPPIIWHADRGGGVGGDPAACLPSKRMRKFSDSGEVRGSYLRTSRQELCWQGKADKFHRETQLFLLQKNFQLL